MRRRHRAFEERSFPGLLSRAADSVLVRLPVKLHFLPRSAPTEIPFANGAPRHSGPALFRPATREKDCNRRCEWRRRALRGSPHAWRVLQVLQLEQVKVRRTARANDLPPKRPKKLRVVTATS